MSEGARPATIRLASDRRDIGKRSAVERRNEWAVVPQPKAEAAATPLIMAWSRVARDSRFGWYELPVA